jgi:hypothetical protein
MRIDIRFRGTSPLVQHNERLSDPSDDFTRQIKAFTDKGKKQTDDDRAQVARLEWQGGLYLNEDRHVIVPAANIVKCVREAATVTKQGKRVAQALSPLALQYLLTYAGQNDALDINELYDNPRFRFRRMVKVSGRVARMRPIFDDWSLVASFMLLESVMDLAAIQGIVEEAGIGTGLGEARIIGYGRFHGEVSVATVTERRARVRTQDAELQA